MSYSENRKRTPKNAIRKPKDLLKNNKKSLIFARARGEQQGDLRMMLFFPALIMIVLICWLVNEVPEMMLLLALIGIWALAVGPI